MERERGWGLARLVDRFDAWVSRRVDARARELGWTITRIPGTRTQVYRSPLATCQPVDLASSAEVPR